jgi:hypothetical protein
MLSAVAKDVRTVTTPDGRCFTIFLGAPGSLLDAGSEPLPYGIHVVVPSRILSLAPLAKAGVWTLSRLVPTGISEALCTENELATRRRPRSGRLSWPP